VKCARRIEAMGLSELLSAKRNPKRHHRDLRRSLQRFGYVEPIILDERTGRIVAGHGRLAYLLELKGEGLPPPEGIRMRMGEWLVPVLRGWASRDDTEAEAYLLASNRLGEAGGWDEEQLDAIVRELSAAGALDGIGFDLGELPDLSLTPEEPAPLPEAVVPEGPLYVSAGDLWILGAHRLLVADCREPANMARLFGQERAAVAVTSPPYAAQREYDKASGFVPIPPERYAEWFQAVADNVARVLTPDGSYLLNIKAHCEDGQRSLYVYDLVLAHVRQWRWRLVDDFCWRNTRDGVPGGWNNRFKNAWEPVFHFSRQQQIKFRPEAVSHSSDDVFDYSSDNEKSGSGSGLLGAEKAGGYRQGLARPSNVIEAAAESS